MRVGKCCHAHKGETVDMGDMCRAGSERGRPEISSNNCPLREPRHLCRQLCHQKNISFSLLPSSPPPPPTITSPRPQHLQTSIKPRPLACHCVRQMRARGGGGGGGGGGAKGECCKREKSAIVTTSLCATYRSRGGAQHSWLGNVGQNLGTCIWMYKARHRSWSAQNVPRAEAWR